MRRSVLAAVLSSKDTNANTNTSPALSCSGAGFGTPSFPKQFKPPVTERKASLRHSSKSSSRPRKRYTDENAPENSDDDEYRWKKLNGQDSPPRPVKTYPVYEAKSSVETIAKVFRLPEMRDKKGNVIIKNLSNGALGVCRRPDAVPRPAHDPLADHAIVLWDPTVDDPEWEKDRQAELKRIAEEREKERNRGPHKSLAMLLGINMQPKVDKVPVVIDPRVSKILRPHQIEGVKFLYKATTGAVAAGASGCIMADEMGLGKTLQCITLLWTLLKQSPVPGKSTIEKAIITCPASLVKNWANELVKWLGPSAINALAIDGSIPKAQLQEIIKQWCVQRGRAVVQPVIIVSYETLRNLCEALGSSSVGLLLCDEAHRLKNANNQTYQQLSMINASRRVLLTGTPIQNDLTEYFSLLNFALPDYLGSRSDFRKTFELAILKGRDADASEQARERCQQKLKELGELVNKFVIRRTNDLLTKYLPRKFEHIVFCNLSPFQLEVYKLLVDSPDVRSAIRASGVNPLVAINMFQKLCNHPDLLDLTSAKIPGLENILPPGYNPHDRRREVVPEHSGKMIVLDRFLVKMMAETDDKIVLISNYTETLDVIGRLLRQHKYPSLMIDGSTSIRNRQKAVNIFNDKNTKERVMLLSSKAGGCGINLIGANRLILFDPDWNPASDQQALARVWRDGQKKTCFVYRFMAAGTVEEKIFQRQAHKQALSSAVVDSNEAAERHFTQADLKQLFKYNDVSLSETHDTFKCKRCKNGVQVTKAPAMLYGDTSTWNHYTNEHMKDVHDDFLRAETGLDAVKGIFQFISS